MSAMITETPSRIWRRIEAVEDRDMPSLPSLPGFEEDEPSIDIDSDSEHDGGTDSDLPTHSTPALSSHRSSAGSQNPSSTSSTQRFANSFARSRASQSGSRATSSKDRSYSFDVSAIPSLPDVHGERSTYHFSEEEDTDESKDSVPDARRGDEDDMSLSDALQSVSRSNSPYPDDYEPTPKKHFDMVVPLRSEPKNTHSSLSRTAISPASSPANSTPHSTRSLLPNRSQAESPSRGSPTRSLQFHEESPLPGTSVPLPRSASNSPAVRPDRSDSLSVDFSDREQSVHSETQSMDITDAHISPIRNLEGEGQQPEQSQSRETTEDDNIREPTFSSEGDNTPYPARYAPQSSPAAEPSTHSASSPSFAFTPTPAFPRPRARFNLPPPPDDLLATPAQRSDEAQEELEPLTPHTRRKSFLLSIVNSTTRPRMKMPTPHPRHRIDLNTQAVDSTPGPSSSGITPAMNLQSAFGATPSARPRFGRPSHPLAQGFTASDSDSDNTRASLGVSPVAYDGAVDRASFISTASSHDLTTNIRANTSFDPAMGFGVGAQATGRFNASKLNTYLHGLNRRLQEENEILIERLRQLEEERNGGDSAPDENVSTTSSNRRLSGNYSRRLSAGPTTLGDVQEDAGEGWMEEKAELEEMVEVYKDEIEKNVIEREELEKTLEAEQKERARDQERWKERMAEVEQGVEGIIGELEQKLQDAETRAKQSQDAGRHREKELELQLETFRADKDLAIDRAEKAEKALSSGLDLGGDLKEANQRVSNLMSDMRNSNAQLREMEEDVARAEERIGELEKDLREEKGLVKELERELNNKMDELDAESEKLRQARGELQNAADEVEGTKAYVSELEASNAKAAERVEALEHELDTAKSELRQMQAEADDAEQCIAALEAEVGQAAELARQMEDALDAAERKMTMDDEQLSKLKGQVATLERERDRAREASRRVSEPSRSMAPVDTADLEALEEELDEAHREIARLNTVINSSPVRKTMDKAKDMRIEMLEKENEALAERVKTWKYNTSEFATPSKLANMSGISPAHRQALSFHLKTPKTPGGPLKDLTWLHNATADSEFSPLILEISRLHHELDRANESVDDKLDKLEDAGLGVVSLTRKLEDARARIVALEDEIARLSRKEDRRTRRMEKLRCQKCLTKVRVSDADESSLDISRSTMATEPPTPPTRTSEALRVNLRSVNSQLASMKKDWEKERQQLVKEKAVLQDVANRLNDKIRNATEEAAKASQAEKTGQALRGDIQSDLDKAKRSIADLEEALKTERAQLRVFTVEQTRVSQERENVLAQLRRTESDMDDVKQQLQRFKKENHDMEKELRENAETIERLRQERSLLASDHKQLQKKFSEASEHVNRLRDEHASSQTLHDNRRHQLDLHMAEIDELRRALSDQAEELQRTEAEKKRISAERSEVSRTVASLEADLRRVKKDAEAFAEAKQKDDLAKAQRARKQTEAQIRLLTEQIEVHKMKAVKFKDQFEKHVCVVDEQQLSAIKLQHNKECKGLIVQIRYLKAKFVRESTLRFDLVYQKQYLMVLLGHLEKSEQTIFAAISKIGFPVKLPSPAPPRPRRKFKSVAMMVVFMARIRRCSQEWQKQCGSKGAVAAALQDVRKRRSARP
ncbi:hypothetical protein BDZ89DRAFT_1057909 [Hymenopellis radicata]|nr:hypothetical protein BDZ89DRAFT_1057909 [Hymenopellis radicata]